MAVTRSAQVAEKAQREAEVAAQLGPVEAAQLNQLRATLNAQLDTREAEQKAQHAQLKARANLVSNEASRRAKAEQMAADEAEAEGITPPAPQQMNPANPAGGIPTNPYAELGGVAGSLATNGQAAPTGQGGGVLGGAGVQQGMVGQVAGGQPMAPGAVQGGGLFGVPPTLTTSRNRNTSKPVLMPDGTFRIINTNETSRETTPNALTPYQYGQLMNDAAKTKQEGWVKLRDRLAYLTTNISDKSTVDKVLGTILPNLSDDQVVDFVLQTNLEQTKLQNEGAWQRSGDTYRRRSEIPLGTTLTAPSRSTNINANIIMPGKPTMSIRSELQHQINVGLSAMSGLKDMRDRFVPEAHTFYGQLKQWGLEKLDKATILQELAARGEAGKEVLKGYLEYSSYQNANREAFSKWLYETAGKQLSDFEIKWMEKVWPSLEGMGPEKARQVIDDLYRKRGLAVIRSQALLNGDFVDPDLTQRYLDSKDAVDRNELFADRRLSLEGMGTYVTGKIKEYAIQNKLTHNLQAAQDGWLAEQGLSPDTLPRLSPKLQR